uniref:Uncharacterized protein n=1 Tax=viral metagenome TaxID=1070528 RepID=A0A6M3LFW4_9ZZZZ
MNMAETNDGSVQAPAVDDSQPVADTPAPQAPVEPVTSQLPVEAPDRTKQQFDKLIESNRKLFESNQIIQEQLEAQRLANAKPVQPAKPIDTDDFIEIDPNTGDRLINEQRLKAKIEELNNRASKVDTLEKTVEGMRKSVEQREIDRQEKETFAAYPELDSRKETYDPNFNKLVRATLTDSFYAQDDYGGKPLTFKEAADLVRTSFPKKPAQPEPAAKQTAEELKAAEAASKEAQAGKEQGSAQAVSQPSSQVKQDSSDEETLKDLRYKTRYLNDDQALAERIKHTEHILPKGGSES